ncbi:MAG: methylenetetrahydrofolate reductase C-terminal domain-containing protein [Chloroflexota bacterium]|nr:methylenetetrahydrofolate reductase C-terminal domain-containing protein [Chloroflexota bacterium]
MIVAQRKPFEEIVQNLQGFNSVFILGCGTCVAVCMAGGEKEVGILASQLRMAFKKAGQEVEIGEATITRQCDREYIETIREQAAKYDVILSMACGIGVQYVGEILEPQIVTPALNTRFLGANEAEGEWGERCRACGNCILAETGGICPMTICAKSLVNGPCGGTNDGKCEVSKEKDCAWTIIYNRLEKQGKLDNIRKIFPPKKYSAQSHPARQVNEAYQKAEMGGE